MKMHLKDYLKEVAENTDIKFSDDILKMNLSYLFTDQTAVLDGNHIRLSTLSRVDLKHVDVKDGEIDTWEGAVRELKNTLDMMQ